MWGDLPIVKEVFPDDEAILVAACKRMPRNEVARFILEDLDTAIDYMSDNFESRHTRISKDVAILMKSRVALFEGSWLTNLKVLHLFPMAKAGPAKRKNIMPAINILQEASRTRRNSSLKKLQRQLKSLLRNIKET